MRTLGVLRGGLSGGGDILDWERLRARSWWDRLVCDKARLGTCGESVDEAEERGWLVTVADRLGKYDSEDSSGDESSGDMSGVVIDEE